MNFVSNDPTFFGAPNWRGFGNFCETKDVFQNSTFPQSLGFVFFCLVIDGLMDFDGHKKITSNLGLEDFWNVFSSGQIFSELFWLRLRGGNPTLKVPPM